MRMHKNVQRNALETDGARRSGPLHGRTPKERMRGWGDARGRGRATHHPQPGVAGVASRPEHDLTRVVFENQPNVESGCGSGLTSFPFFCVQHFLTLC